MPNRFDTRHALSNDGVVWNAAQSFAAGLTCCRAIDSNVVTTRLLDGPGEGLLLGMPVSRGRPKDPKNHGTHASAARDRRPRAPNVPSEAHSTLRATDQHPRTFRRTISSWPRSSANSMTEAVAQFPA